MLKKLLFNTHWLIGISAGIILSIVGVSGAILSLEHFTLDQLNAKISTVEVTGASLSPAQLSRRVLEENENKIIRSLVMYSDANKAAKIQLTAADNPRERIEYWINPYTGKTLGSPKGEDFFNGVMRLHRWLFNREYGKHLVAGSTIALVFLSLSGLYLRWPKLALRWRSWFYLNFKLKGRGFWWSFHSVIGTWLLPIYILASLTGLYFSYDWYRDIAYTVVGVEKPAPRNRNAPISNSPELALSDPAYYSLDQAWIVFKENVPSFSIATLPAPNAEQSTFSIRYQDSNPEHSRANNTMIIDLQHDERIVSHLRYDTKKINEKIIGSMLPLHSGEFFGISGQIIIGLASLFMPFFAVSGWILYLQRRKLKIARALREKNLLTSAMDTA